MRWLAGKSARIVGDCPAISAALEAQGARIVADGASDILVHVAAPPPVKPAHELSHAEWRAALDAGLDQRFLLARDFASARREAGKGGALLYVGAPEQALGSDHAAAAGALGNLAATHAAAPLMIREGRGGAILNVASIEAERAAPNSAVYAACKAGMVSFSKSMAIELSGHGIRVNCIAPDHTVTPGNQGNRAGPVDPANWRKRSLDEVDAMNRLIPLGREGSDGECGDAAVFLCSSLASYITSVVLPVDGGTWAAGGWVRGRDGKWTLDEGLSFGG